MNKILVKNKTLKAIIELGLYPAYFAITLFIINNFDFQKNFVIKISLIQGFYLLILTALERIIPSLKEKNLRVLFLKRDFKFLILFFILIMFIDKYFPLIYSVFNIQIKNSSNQNIFNLISVIILIFIHDLLFYFFHRVSHSTKKMLRLLYLAHNVHHEPKQVYALTHAVLHPLQGIIFRIILFSLFIFPFQSFITAEAFHYATIIIIAQGWIIHSNIDLRIGFLEYILITPKLHRIHHINYTDGKVYNYATCFSIIDIIFGSYKNEYPNSKYEFGLGNDTDCPRSENIISTLVYPFRSLFREVKGEGS